MIVRIAGAQPVFYDPKPTRGCLKKERLIYVKFFATRKVFSLKFKPVTSLEFSTYVDRDRIGYGPI